MGKQDTGKRPDRKAYTLIPIGGLANRFYAITSAIAFCRDQQATLRVVWFKDWGMGADFHSLFTLAETVADVNIIDARRTDFPFDRPRKKNLWLPGLFQRASFDTRLSEQDVYDLGERFVDVLTDARKGYFVQFRPFYKKGGIISDLQPIRSLQDRIAERIRDFAPHTVGVHIRRSDNAGAIQKSPIELFIEKMRLEIEADPSVRFYIASDSSEEKRTLIDLFGDRIITILDEVRRDTQNGIEEAVVELYALSHTSRIYGSHESSYSTLAALISTIELQVLTKKD